MRVKRPVDAWESSEGRISVFEPPPSQTPNPKHQRSSKSQAPNPKNRCRGKRRAGRFLSLELRASLELGVWNLELVAWAPSFSKIECTLERGNASLLFAQ